MKPFVQRPGVAGPGTVLTFREGAAIFETHSDALGLGCQDAVRVGFRHGARVVTAAALIMISVFAGFIVPEEPIIKSIGFVLAVGILFDAFVVRMTIVPAVMAMLGARAWYIPKCLDRIIPNVDLEGAGLERRPDPDPEPSPRPTAEPAGAEA